MIFEQPLFDTTSGTIKTYKEIYVLTQKQKQQRESKNIMWV